MEGLLSRLYNRVSMIVARGRVTSVDDTQDAIQFGQLDLGPIGPDGASLQLRDATPLLYVFGLTSNPPVGSDILALAIGGDHNKLAALATGHQKYRLKGLAAGDTALYDIRGAYLWFQPDGIVLDAAGGNVTVQNANNITITNSGSTTLNTSGDVTLNVGGDEAQTVTGNVTDSADGDVSRASTGGVIDDTADGDVTRTAGGDITDTAAGDISITSSAGNMSLSTTAGAISVESNSGNLTLNADAGIATLSGGDVAVSAPTTGNVTIECGSGHKIVITTASVAIAGNTTISGNLSVTGNVSATNFKAGAVDLLAHIHGGVTTGAGNTTGPSG